MKPNFSQDPNYEVKQQILKDCKIASTNESDPLAFYIHRNNIPDNFFRMMRVLVMNALEVQCYLNCSDSVLLDFIGYRNELSMISMVLMLLKNKLHALRSVTLEEENITESQRYALMYRRGKNCDTEDMPVTDSFFQAKKRFIMLQLKRWMKSKIS